MEGFGLMIFDDGTKYYCFMKNGLRNGVGKVVYANREACLG